MADLYYAGNARSEEQTRRMRDLSARGECLFCGAGGEVYETRHWRVLLNDFPYKGARHHWLLVPKLHVDELLSLPADARDEFWSAIEWVRHEYDLGYYGVGIRSGDARFTGGTISHLHVHIIVGDVDDPQHEPVRLKLSSRPQDG